MNIFPFHFEDRIIGHTINATSVVYEKYDDGTFYLTSHLEGIVSIGIIDYPFHVEDGRIWWHVYVPKYLLRHEFHFGDTLEIGNLSMFLSAVEDTPVISDVFDHQDSKLASVAYAIMAYL